MDESAAKVTPKPEVLEENHLVTLTKNYWQEAKHAKLERMLKNSRLLELRAELFKHRLQRRRTDNFDFSGLRLCRHQRQEQCGHGRDDAMNCHKILPDRRFSHRRCKDISGKPRQSPETRSPRGSHRQPARRRHLRRPSIPWRYRASPNRHTAAASARRRRHSAQRAVRG